MLENYRTGELPKIGDAVAGCPNRSELKVSGLVQAVHEDMISLVVVSQFGKLFRIYGEASKFELLGRN